MKKSLFAIASVAVLAGVVTFSSCKKEDTTPPSLTVAGGTNQTISLNSSWSDPAATATDDEDGDISSSVTITGGPVNPNLKGTYVLTYSVSDAAGNTASLDVTVNVVNDAEYLAGNYPNAHDTCQVTAPFNYNASITTSNTTNNAFVINNFGGFGTTVNVNASVSGTTISVPASQTLGGSASIVACSGTVVTTSPVYFTLTYTWTDGTANEVCMSKYWHQ